MTEQIALIVTFDPKPGREEEFKRHLFSLVEQMSQEPHFQNTIVHDELDTENRIILYEIWAGTRDRWLAEEPSKPYRRAYEAGLDDLLRERRVQWLMPSAEWGSSLIEAAKQNQLGRKT